MGAEAFADLVRILIADEAAGDFGPRLRWQHRLEPFAGVTADDPGELAGRA